MRLVSVGWVILTEMASCFGGGFIAGFVTGVLGGFLGIRTPLSLAGLLMIPSMLGVSYLAGGWLVRGRPSPTALEIKIGCVVFTAASTMLSSVAHPAAGATSLIAGAGTSFVLYRSAQRTRLMAVATAQKDRPHNNSS